MELNPPTEEMEQLLDAVQRRVIEYIDSLPKQPSHDTRTADDVAARVREPLPECGAPLDEILSLLFDSAIPCSLNTAGPGYLAYIPGGGLYSGAAAEYLAAAVNRYAGVWLAAPGAVEIETQAIRWLAELIGVPGYLGVLTTGGSMSNLLALAAARDKLLGEDFQKGTVYFSDEVHYSLPKAAHIVGVPARNLREIPTDDNFRMRLDALEAQIERDRTEGLKPFFLCGSAGTVNTGAVDPLEELAHIARNAGLWYHVDGAYGAAFGMVEEFAPKLAGMARADSIAVDPHKGLFLSYGNGALLTPHLEDLKRTFSDSAAYMPAMQQNPERLDFFAMTPELSRDWRGLRLWLPFKLHGVQRFRDALTEKRRLAREAYSILASQSDIETTGEPELTVFGFRKRFQGLCAEATNERNRELLRRINAQRRVFLSGTTLGEDYYLRVCVLHLRTDEKKVMQAVKIIAHTAAELRAE